MVFVQYRKDLIGEQLGDRKDPGMSDYFLQNGISIRMF